MVEMKRMFSENDILEMTLISDGIGSRSKRMWSEYELRKLEIITRFGNAIWEEVEPDSNFSKVKRLHTQLDIKRMIQTWNLAIPDLTGKEYLGDGWYRYFGSGSNTLDYNVYNGYYRLNGTLSNLYLVDTEFDFDLSKDYYLIMNVISGTTSWPGRPEIYVGSGGDGHSVNPKNKERYIPVGYNWGNKKFRFTLNGSTYDNFIFTVQFEQGSTATPIYQKLGVGNGLNISMLNMMFDEGEITEEEYNTMKMDFIDEEEDLEIINIKGEDK